MFKPRETAADARRRLLDMALLIALGLCAWHAVRRSQAGESPALQTWEGEGGRPLS